MSSKSRPPIAIIGAGLAGLALGQGLRSKGIKAVIFEKSTEKARGSYGITFNESLSQILRPCALSKDPKTACVTWTDSSRAPRNDGDIWVPFRANRARLESQLREGLDIRWEHKLESIERRDAANLLRFSGQADQEASLIVASDGVHSKVRNLYLPDIPLRVLQFVVYNSRRKMPMSEWQQIYEPFFGIAVTSTTSLECHVAKTRLQIAINDLKADEVDLSCTFSRSAKSKDALHDPERQLSQATVIPEQLFEELDFLKEQLQEPFTHAFDAERTRQSRLLHWLMRTVLVDKKELKKLAEEGIALIGDAAHACPIVGSTGAARAMRDGLLLARYIVDEQPDPVSRFYDDAYYYWLTDVQQAEDKFAQLHRPAEKLA